MKNQGALAGITVLDLSRLLPGPFCSMILADHGARVIAIESKKFKADGLYLKSINRNKAHMSLDVNTPAGKAIFLHLVQKADVVMEGFRPGVARRLGIDYEAVSRVNPEIIYCSITAYGQTGPYRDRVGHDVNCLAISGVLNLIGEKDRPPAIPGIQLADMAGGGLNAAIGILLALFARQVTGKGQYIDISMTDGMVGMLPVALFLRELSGEDPPRSDSFLSHRYACYNTYETADGRSLCIGAVEHRFWKNFCETVGRPDLIALQFDEGRRQEVIDDLRQMFMEKPLSHWQAVFGQRDICWAPIHDLSAVCQDAHLRQRKMLIDIEEKKGQTATALGVPIKLSQTPGSIRTPAVDFGENTRQILLQWGYSEQEVAEWETKGVI
jgi:crotonobetainyl-CoA:carnitine CoA-transferase CaiB-like acyl-CoA transferase